ncbi:MAG: PAS domain S-box protein [Prolixibacteraceae bacterium]
MKTITPGNLRLQLIALVIVVSIGILLSGRSYYNNQKKKTQNEKYIELQAISQLKANQLSQWYKERLSEASFFSSSLPNTGFSTIRIPKEEELLLRNSLARIMTNKRYENIFILNKKGQLLFSVIPGFVFNHPSTASHSNEVFVTRKITVFDFYFCETDKKIHFEIVAPVINSNDEVIASMVFRINPADYLYPLILQWPTPNRTAETVLVHQKDNKVWYLNELRHFSNSSLQLSFPLDQKKEAAVRAALGHTGYFEGPDYAGHMVIGDIRKVADTPWYLIAKMDTSELYAELNKRAMLIVIIDFLAIFFIGLIIILLYHNRQRNMYKELLTNTSALYQSQKEFGAILYSIGDGVITTNKEGCVKHLNPVAEKLTGWTEQEAKDKNIEEVFHLVNEETNDPIDSPVDKVLREGKITGLANHTLLISKNGERTPISDSGAPIKDDQGNVIGVVIVFSDETGERLRKEALRESEERHRTLISKMQLGLAVHEIITDAEGTPVNYRFLYINPGYEKLTGLKSQDIVGKTVLEVLPNTEKTWIERFGKVALTGTLDSFESYAQELDKYYSVLAYRYRQNEFAVIVEDITSRKQMEMKLRESEERYRLISDNSLDAIMLTWPNGSIISANPAACEMFGMTEDEMLALEDYELVDKKDPHFSELIEKRERDGNVKGELTCFRKDGSRFPVEASSSVFKDSRGTKLISVIVRDITERKKTEDALRESEKNYRELIDGMNETVWVIDLEGNIIEVNKTAVDLLGYSKEELLSFNLSRIDSSLTDDAIADLIENMPFEKLQIFETSHRKKDGTVFPIEICSSLINYKGRKAILSIARDITIRKQMEERLHKNEETIRLLFNSTAEGIYMIDMKGICTFCNKSALSLLGYDREEELTGQDMHRLIHHSKNDGSPFPNDECKIMQALQNGQATHIDNEVFWKKDESCFPAEYWSYPVRSNDQLIGSVITFLDVSQRKYDETVQQTLYEIARTSMTSKTLEDLLIIARRELNKLIDTTNFHVALYHPETDTFQRVFFVNEMHHKEERKSDNTLCKLLIRSGKTLLLRKEDVIRAAVENEIVFSGPPPVCWLGVPLTNGGKTLGIVGVQSYSNPNAYNEKSARLLEMVAPQLTNVIQRTKMIQELIAAKEKAEESDRLQAAFLANMSHEIRTPMNGILGFLELLSEPDLEEESKKDFIEIVNKSGRRLLDTINDIVEISKIEAGESKVLYTDVNVEEVLKFHHDFFLPQATEKGLHLIILQQITGTRAFIRTDRHKLDGILTNLIKNALKFTQQGRIELGNYLEKEWLVFYVKDSGRGISPERLEAIFERFVQADQNLTRAHEGSGLGLSITKAHVNALGGKISVESEPGKGSTFIFKIPYTQAKAQETTEASGVSLSSVSSKEITILIAEDDESSYQYLRFILEKENFNLIHTLNGEDTIAVVRNNPGISLVLMDIKMPGMDGLEATVEIRKFNKTVPIIAQTAYALSNDDEKAKQAGCNDYIAKPINRAKLFKLIEKYVADPTSPDELSGS